MPSPAYAAFTRDALWKLDEIRHNYAGSFCFQPGTVHERTCTNDTLASLMSAHINNTRGAGLSIAYYDLVDYSTLGGASWNGWNDTTLPSGLCMTGAENSPSTRTTNGPQYLTVCRFADRDNDHDVPSAHVQECAIALPQAFVEDGCYVPPALITPAVEKRASLDGRDLFLAIIGAISSIIAIWGAAWTAARYLRKQRASRVERAAGDKNADTPPERIILVDMAPARVDIDRHSTP